MINKYFTVCCFILFLNIYNLFSENKTILKAFEFSIGGGIENSFNYKYENEYFYFNYNSHDIENNFRYDNNIISLGTHIFVPASFIFYLNPKFGIGIKIQNGIILFSPNYILSNIYSINYRKTYSTGFWYSGGLINDVLIINKFGNYFNNSLLLEYGLSTFTGLYSSTNIEVLLGPKIMTGFEKFFKKNTAFVIGGNISTLFKIYPTQITYNQSFFDIIRNRNQETTTKYINNFTMLLTIGIEARFKFSFIKEFL